MSTLEILFHFKTVDWSLRNRSVVFSRLIDIRNFLMKVFKHASWTHVATSALWQEESAGDRTGPHQPLLLNEALTHLPFNVSDGEGLITWPYGHTAGWMTLSRNKWNKHRTLRALADSDSSYVSAGSQEVLVTFSVKDTQKKIRGWIFYSTGLYRPVVSPSLY